MKENKIKSWVKDHKEDIKDVMKVVIPFTVGFYIGGRAYTKIVEYSTARGFEALHGDGIIKLFDPSTGTEIGVTQACELVNKKYFN